MSSENGDAAEFVAWVEDDPDDEMFIDEVRYACRHECREFAVVEVGDGRVALLAGGEYAIALPLGDDGRVLAPTPDGLLWIRRLLWHTHPRATGPSDADRALLRLLGQATSRVHEVGGEPGGTQFSAEKSRG